MTAATNKHVTEADSHGNQSGKQFLIAHVIHRLQMGGLENGLVNLINNMPTTRYRHIIICMTEVTDFKNRLISDTVECYALNKKAGKDFSVYLKLWKLFRRVKPDIVHSRNIGTIDCVVPAFFSGVKHHVHGEHGRDMVDIDGSNRRYIALRRLMSPLISRFIALSKDLEQWLIGMVRISDKKITQIYNGVDVDKFTLIDRGTTNSSIVFGTIGRLSDEKDQRTVIDAFKHLLDFEREKPCDLKLIIIGDGPLETTLKSLVKQHGIAEWVTFTGARNDVPHLLQKIDVFVLPSLGEGISNTILEAMASGLPVIATNVGGNPELVEHEKTGFLVPVKAPKSMAITMNQYVKDRNLLSLHGSLGRQRVEKYFSMPKMVENYSQVYDDLLKVNISP